MSDAPEPPRDSTRDWRDTVFLPKTDFPMKAGLAQKEPAILARWAKLRLYDRLREQRAGAKRFILHDGPPYANGDIHMGHAMNKVLKDIIVRSQSLMGKDAPYVPGWDCHGLPIEWKVEEAYRAKKLDKDQVPVAQFRAECRAYAEKWVAVQRQQFERLGVMGDWDDPYLTMKHEAEAAIVGELLKFAESGQLYRGSKPVMWSPVEKTALAEAEVEYQDDESTQIDVAFEILDAPNAPELKGAYAVIWTTTPWTIPVNQALAYGPEIEYVLIQIMSLKLLGTVLQNQNVNFLQPSLVEAKLLVAVDLLAIFEARLSSYLTKHWRSMGEKAGVVSPFYEKRGVFKGSDLGGATARHPIANLLSPLPFRGGEGGGAYPQAVSSVDRPHPNPSPEGEGLRFFLRPRPFLPGEFVTTDAGTGLVHMAPDHGEDDFLLCKQYGIGPVFAVDGAGMYRADWAWLGGQGSVINKKFVSADGPICADLRAAGALLAASDDFPHSYPHSWRSKAKVIFRATPQWFIPMDRQESPSRSREGLGEGVSPDAALATTGPPPTPPASGRGEGNGATLREIALDAIARTRWVPARAENRIRSMVEGRPDWVISRQRAWGVPIALYVNRATGDYLNDPAVNARIVEAFGEGGADAWFTADHQTLLGDAYRAADYEVVTDILDVWFDSGSTHAFVIEARYGEGVRADLYLEGSDQHRGWFQSSLLESAGTRGRAPYDAVLTHGFALDQTGRKMSKSLGNVVDPLRIIQESGADILRMWVASTDYFDDVKIGKEVLGTASDAYRKLRNTFRYLLGALDGFDAAEKVAPAAMPALERHMLDLLIKLDAELRAAADNYEFNRYLRLITDFAQDDLSAFFFDIRKDSLYCDAPGDPTRRAYRTMLDLLFHALVRYAAPILCFTAEEAWQSRYPSEEGSVHFLEWPELPAPADDSMARVWADVRALRVQVTEAIEPLRRDKRVRSSLEAEVTVPSAPLPVEALAELFIVAKVALADQVAVTPTTLAKCGRCWRHLPDVAADGDLCGRCERVVAA